MRQKENKNDQFFVRVPSIEERTHTKGDVISLDIILNDMCAAVDVVVFVAFLFHFTRCSSSV